MATSTSSRNPDGSKKNYTRVSTVKKSPPLKLPKPVKIPKVVTPVAKPVVKKVVKATPKTISARDRIVMREMRRGYGMAKYMSKK